MEFNWKYALDKILIFLTSAKSVAILAAACLALFGFELPPEVQVYIIQGAGIALALFKFLDSVFDKTAKPE